MPYIPEECQYMAKIENGKLKARMNDIHVEFAKAIIKDMEQYLKLTIPCHCSICVPNTTIEDSKKELLTTMTKVVNLTNDIMYSDDKDKIDDLIKQMKKFLVMSIDNCQIHLKENL